MPRRIFPTCGVLLLVATTFSSSGQAQDGILSNDQVIEKANPSIALVLAGRSAGSSPSIGAAAVFRQNGILLTAYHLVKDAYALQVRFKSGEVFDQVQLLGVDVRRDVAAIKITAAALPALPIAVSAQAKAGDGVTVVAHPAGLPWSGSTGVISAFRLADEVPGAGSGYRLIQFTAPSSQGSSGGVLLDSRGNALGLIVGSVMGGQNLNFAVPLDSVVGLSETAPTKSFASGAGLAVPNNVVTTSNVPAGSPFPPPVGAVQKGPDPNAPDQSDLLSASKDRDFILRNFRTMFVDAQGAGYFGSDQLKAALGRNKDFAKLNIRIVDDRKVADTILVVGYTFAWDYPFELKHQNTTIVLLAGKGVGPFSGVAGAANVANELAKLAKPYRITSPTKK
jgi:S1-C subfamily serine protease